jgi:EpsD family peptidyl-prolyl cis-trans isomerase
MKKGLALAAVVALTATSLAGCDKVKGLLGRKPSGQVVATVNGEEITTLELRSQMGGFASRDPEVMKRAQQAALNQLILQDLVVQEAKKEKLDKSVDYNLQVERGKKAVLAQLFQRRLVQTVTVPNRSDADAFIAAHPEMFANRQVLVVDQVVARPKKMDPEKFRPLKTLDEIKSALDSDNSPYQENVATLDSATADPRLMQQIAKLPSNEVFVVPQNGAFIFNHVREVRTLPVRGDAAVAIATQFLQQQRAREAVAKRLEAIRTSAEGKITYNEAFKNLKTPLPKPGAAAPAAGAPAVPPPPPAAPAVAAPAAAPAKAP